MPPFHPTPETITPSQKRHQTAQSDKGCARAIQTSKPILTVAKL